MNHSKFVELVSEYSDRIGKIATENGFPFLLGITIGDTEKNTSSTVCTTNILTPSLPGVILDHAHAIHSKFSKKNESL